MRRLRDIPIRVKLMILLMGVVTVALLLSTTAHVILSSRELNDMMVKQHTTSAGLVANSSVGGIQFNDSAEVERVLAKLELLPTVLFACVYDENQKVVATYLKEGADPVEPPPVGKPGEVFREGGDLDLFQDIVQEDELIGTVYMLVSTDELNKQIRNDLMVAVLAFVAVLAVAILMGVVLQRAISRPILELAGAMGEVSQNADFSIRVDKTSEDELGVLTDGFNTMLSQIQARDAELEEHRRNLERLVKKRTASLETRTEDLAQSNADLAQFAYVASHDLQEPLRAVTGFTQLLQRRYTGKLDEKADTYIQNVVEGTTRMQTLLNDLLTYSRVGSHGEEFEPTDCNEVIRSAMANLQVAIEERDAKVTVRDVPTVIGDSTQLIQLFQNLIGNAIKYSERRPEIVISSETREDDFLFSVSDNGIGIDPVFRDRIFVIFQRLHTRLNYTGTGIGLAICKRISERHGGTIWVEEAAGGGSMFCFTIAKGSPPR